MIGLVRKYFRERRIDKSVVRGRNVSIRGNVVASGDIGIDDNTIINTGCVLRASAGKGRIRIGRFCSIAHNVYICTFNHNMRTPSIWGTYDKSVKCWDLFPPAGADDSKDIMIGNDVWIGTNVAVMPGVTIGNGTIIGANSVVTKDVPDYGITAGVPAKIIRFRFDEQVIAYLLGIAWWNWDDDRLRSNTKFFATDLTLLSVQEIEKIVN